MNPNLQQLESWVMHNGFDMQRIPKKSVRLTAYSQASPRADQDVIATAIVHAPFEMDDASLLNLAARNISNQLCILAPGAALRLNAQHA